MYFRGIAYTFRGTESVYNIFGVGDFKTAFLAGLILSECRQLGGCNDFVIPHKASWLKCGRQS